MDTINQIIRSLELGIWHLLALIVSGIAATVVLARAQLVALHISPDLQPLILLAVTALLVVLAVRLFAGLLRLLLVVLLLALAVQVIFPLARLLP